MADPAAKESADRLARAQRLAHVGSWTVDIITGTRTWSDEMYRLLGYEPGEVEPALERVLEQLHPAEAEGVRSRVLADQAHPGGWEEEVRIVLPEGELRWLACRTEPVRGRSGDVVGVHGMSQDVTERRPAQVQLRFQAKLLNAVGEAIIATDLEGAVMYWSPGAERLCGRSAHRLPIVALNAAAKQKDRDRCLSAGMDDHVAKPVGKARLLAAVARWAAHTGPGPVPAKPPEQLKETEW
jgi:PAS domain S-box-containing protein